MTKNRTVGHAPLIARCIVMFGKPDSADPARFVAEIARLVAGYSDAVQNKAADHLIAAGGRSWPMPKAIVEACQDAHDALALADSVRGKAPAPAKPPWTVHAEKARAWARTYCTVTPLGRQAFAEGWGAKLFDEARSYARECYRGAREPANACDWQPVAERIAYWKRHGRVPPPSIAPERARLLGDDASASMEDVGERRPVDHALADVAARWRCS